MSRSRSTVATQRPTVQKPLTADNPIPDEVIDFLTEGGWVHSGDDRPVTSTLWAHQTKGGGNPLPSEAAYTLEKNAREAQAAVGTGGESEAERDARLAAEAAETAEQTRLREEADAEAERNAEAERQVVADALRKRLDEAAAARAAAAAVPDPEFVHDQIGAVTIWRCYSCKFETRHNATCPCPVCVAITAAKACPNCGDEQPNVDPRRR